MKVLVFLLLLANLLFYAMSAGYFGRPDNPDAGRVEQQVVPERMRIISHGEAPAVPVRRAPPADSAKPAATPESEASTKVADALQASEVKVDTPPVCLAWRQLSAADADSLGAILVKRFADFKLSRKTVATEGNGWWVYIPPQQSKADADRKAGELHTLGVKDFFVVQEGANRLAISLGVFSSEKGSQDRLAELKAKGVRSALAAPRPGKDSVVNLQVRGAATEKAALLAAVAQALPRAEVQDCP